MYMCICMHRHTTHESPERFLLGSSDAAVDAAGFAPSTSAAELLLYS